MEYIIFIVCLFIPVWIARSAITDKKTWLVVRGRDKKNKGENEGEREEMLKLVENLVGKMCEVRTIDNDYQGVIEGVEENWIVLKDRWLSTKIVVNPEYVVGIREIRAKQRKKKSEEPVLAEVAATVADEEASK